MMSIVLKIDDFLQRVYGFETAVRIKNLLLMNSGFVIGCIVTGVVLGLIFLTIIRSLLKIIDECRQNLNEVIDDMQQPKTHRISAHKKPLTCVIPDGYSVLRYKDLILSAPKTLPELLEACIYVILMWLFPNKHIGEKAVRKAKIIFYSLLLIGVILVIIGISMSMNIMNRH